MSEKKALAFLNRGQHEHNDKDDFRTPPYLWWWLNRELGPIEYDGACTPGLNNLTDPLRLEDDWPPASVVYSNPPFDAPSIEKWFEKGEEYASLRGGVHIMLLPDKLCQVFMSRMIPSFSQIIFLGGRVNFISPYAVSGGASMSGSIITIQGNPKSLRYMEGVRAVLLRDIKKEYGEHGNP